MPNQAFLDIVRPSMLSATVVTVIGTSPSKTKSILDRPLKRDSERQVMIAVHFLLLMISALLTSEWADPAKVRHALTPLAFNSLSLPHYFVQVISARLY
jgi:hypothetical protein